MNVFIKRSRTLDNRGHFEHNIPAMKGRVSGLSFHREFPAGERKQTVPGEVHPGAVA